MMRRGLELRLARVEVAIPAISWADRQAAHHRVSLRLCVRLTEIVRERLIAMGMEPEIARCLRRGDGAAAELSGIPDTETLRAADEAIVAADCTDGEEAVAQFHAKIEQPAKRYRDGIHQPDLASASPPSCWHFVSPPRSKNALPSRLDNESVGSKAHADHSSRKASICPSSTRTDMVFSHSHRAAIKKGTRRSWRAACQARAKASRVNSKLRATENSDRTIVQRWFSARLRNAAELARIGIKFDGGGPHQSKTMMLAELTTLLASGATDGRGRDFARDNLLGKPSVRAREAALLSASAAIRPRRGLSDLHRLASAMGPDPAGGRCWLCSVRLHAIPRCGTARRQCSTLSLGNRCGGRLLRQLFEAHTPAASARRWRNRWRKTPRHRGPKPGFSGELFARSGFAQSDPDRGGLRRADRQPLRFRRQRLLECRWLDVLDRPIEDRLALLRQAEGLGLVRVRSAGDVLEIDVRRPIGRMLGGARTCRGLKTCSRTSGSALASRGALTNAGRARLDSLVRQGA